jgi:cation diffusion facilitator family transporter
LKLRTSKAILHSEVQMSDVDPGAEIYPHRHVFLGEAHEQNTRRTWAVVWLSGATMIIEIVGGLLFGSIALVADGIHMSTHAGALLIAAFAYSYARKHANDPDFSFGTGKLGDLAGFTSAIILAMIALLIAYKSIGRFFTPVPISFSEAIPIAGLGLLVNIASVFILMAKDHHHGHTHYRKHDDDHKHAHDHGYAHGHPHTHAAAGGPANVSISRDYNMQAAAMHVVADAAVSVLVIVGLGLAFAFGWLWMDPLAGIIGAGVTASWAEGLIRNAGAILLDMKPDRAMEDLLRQTIESEGDRVVDLHLWRLGPGHLGAIISVVTHEDRDPDYYRARLARFRSLSHLTIEVKSVS